MKSAIQWWCTCNLQFNTRKKNEQTKEISFSGLLSLNCLKNDKNNWTWGSNQCCGRCKRGNMDLCPSAAAAGTRPHPPRLWACGASLSSDSSSLSEEKQTPASPAHERFWWMQAFKSHLVAAGGLPVSSWGSGLRPPTGALTPWDRLCTACLQKSEKFTGIEELVWMNQSVAERWETWETVGGVPQLLGPIQKKIVPKKISCTLNHFWIPNRRWLIMISWKIHRCLRDLTDHF